MTIVTEGKPHLALGPALALADQTGNGPAEPNSNPRPVVQPSATASVRSAAESTPSAIRAAPCADAVSTQRRTAGLGTEPDRPGADRSTWTTSGRTSAIEETPSGSSARSVSTTCQP